MPLVKVDVSDILANVTRQLPTKSDLVEIRRGLGMSALKFWRDQAQKNLKSSSRDYVQALSYREQGSRVFIILDGQVPNMIENGFPGGDMRDWMLKGPNAKMGKNGMYNTIPFRHGTPGSSGRNVGPPMPKIVHNVARKLEQPTQSQASKLKQQGGQPVLYGQRLHPDNHRAGAQIKQILETKKKPWHTTSVYTGMQREQKTYEGATQNQYMSFRRISRNRRSGKDPDTGQNRDSWMHPGIKPRNYARATQKHIEKIMPAVIRLALEGPKRGGGQ